MSSNHKWLRLVALIGLLAILASACGGGDDAGDETEEAAEPTEEEAAEPTEEATEDEATEDEATEEATEEEATEEESAASGDALSLAYLFPETGQLSFLGPPMIAGFQYAIEIINEAGGVNGAEVVASGGDEGDGDGTVANQTVDRLLAEGVHAIFGAASSGISLTVIDKITGAGVAQCSPSNTSPTFTNYEDNGYYFRTAPTDALQGPVLAEQIVAQGGTNVAVLARADDYGQGLLDATVAALEAQGASVAVATTYDHQAQSFDAEVGQVIDSGADALALIAFDEGARILQTLLERGFTPDQYVMFGADGLASNDTPDLVNPEDPSVLAGMFTTSPAPAGDEDFQSALQEFNPDLEDFLFAGESFDCTVAVALAAHAAGENSSDAIVENLVEVTRDGTKCTSYAECLELLDAGEDIDYDGVSGPLDFTDAGEPSTGTYAVAMFNEAGDLEEVEIVTSSSDE